MNKNVGEPRKNDGADVGQGLKQQAQPESSVTGDDRKGGPDSISPRTRSGEVNSHDDGQGLRKLRQWTRLAEHRLDGECRTLLRSEQDRSLGFAIAIERARTVVDISEVSTVEWLVAQLAAITEASDDAMIAVSCEGIVIRWNDGAERLFGYRANEIIGHTCGVLLPVDACDAAFLAQLKSEGGSASHETIAERKDASRIDISLSVFPIKNTAGRVIGTSMVARDISDRKRAEKEHAVVVGEMKHRVKNTLATVLAIANQTLKGISAEDLKSFTSRLRALSAAHDQLTKGEADSASLHDLIATTLRPFQDRQGSRFVIDGPDVALPAQKAVLLTLAIHELATNAVKYGALSTPTGNVRAVWDIDAAHPPRRLAFSWQESGGPSVKPPERRGFGSRLIERTVAAQAGRALFEFAPRGLTCSIDLPLD